MDAVLDHAIRLFAKEEFGNITPDKLSRASGVPAFDIIRRYQSSENILRVVLEREMDLMGAAVQAPNLHDFAQAILDQLRRRAPFLRRVLSEAMRDPQLAAIFHGTFFMKGQFLFSEFLGIRKERGELRGDVNVDAAATAFFSALTGIFLVNDLTGGKEGEEAIRQMCTAFLRGVGRTPGSAADAPVGPFGQ